MTTANIIMAVCLIVLMGVAVWLITRYMRMTTEVRFKAQEIDQEKAGIEVRQKALDDWAEKLKAQKREQFEWEERRKHIYANFEVLDSDENKPNIKAIGKSLSSKIGYALRKELPAIRERHDDKNGGRTIYSVDFYATDYETN
ncbi:MAG: hypothetical protein IJB08_05575 [Alistipes sp.]|nr:hypothetical protein [Alistipes sp.]